MRGGVLGGVLALALAGCVTDVHVGDYPPDGRVVDAGADAGRGDRGVDARPADASADVDASAPVDASDPTDASMPMDATDASEPDS